MWFKHFWCATKPWVWFLWFDPLLPPSSIPCIFMFTNPPSLLVGQSEERSDGSSSVSGAGAGPGESSERQSRHTGNQTQRASVLFFIIINKWCITIATHIHDWEEACIGTKLVDTWSSCGAQFCPEPSHRHLLLFVHEWQHSYEASALCLLHLDWRMREGSLVGLCAWVKCLLLVVVVVILVQLGHFVEKIIHILTVSKC